MVGACAMLKTADTQAAAPAMPSEPKRAKRGLTAEALRTRRTVSGPVWASRARRTLLTTLTAWNGLFPGMKNSGSRGTPSQTRKRKRPSLPWMSGKSRPISTTCWSKPWGELSVVQSAVLRHRFTQRHTRMETAQALHITPQEVRREESKALQLLRGKPSVLCLREEALETAAYHGTGWFSWYYEQGSVEERLVESRKENR